jgi:hypothetical protein
LQCGFLRHFTQHRVVKLMLLALNCDKRKFAFEIIIHTFRKLQEYDPEYPSPSILSPDLFEQQFLKSNTVFDPNIRDEFFIDFRECIFYGIFEWDLNINKMTVLKHLWHDAPDNLGECLNMGFEKFGLMPEKPFFSSLAESGDDNSIIYLFTKCDKFCEAWKSTYMDHSVICMAISAILGKRIDLAVWLLTRFSAIKTIQTNQDAMKIIITWCLRSEYSYLLEKNLKSLPLYQEVLKEMTMREVFDADDLFPWIRTQQFNSTAYNNCIKIFGNPSGEDVIPHLKI